MSDPFVELAINVKSSHMQSLRYLLSHSYFAKTKDRAFRSDLDPKEQPMMPYHEMDENKQSIDPSTLPVVDMWEEFCMYLSKMDTYSTWDPEDRRKLNTCWKYCRERTMIWVRTADVIVFLPDYKDQALGEASVHESHTRSFLNDRGYDGHAPQTEL